MNVKPRIPSPIDSLWGPVTFIMGGSNRRAGYRGALVCICLWLVVATVVSGCGGDAAPPAGSSGTDVTMSISVSLDYSRLTFESMLGYIEAIVEARVVERIPARVNEVDPAALEGASEEGAPMPIPYRGYQVEVIRWYGGGAPARAIALYQMVCGQDGGGGLVSPDFAPGDVLLAPLSFGNNYGVPLRGGEYWMYHEGMTTYVLTDGQANLVVDLEAQDPRIKNRRSATELRHLLSDRGYEEQAPGE